MKKKVYNWPFLVMLFITLFEIIVDTAVYILVPKVPAVNNAMKFPFDFREVLWILLLCTQTIFYRFIRNRIKEVSAVRVHILSNLFCFFLIPLIYGILINFLRRTQGTFEYFETLKTIVQIRIVLFWLVFAIGHACFITTIANIFRRKDTFDIDNEQPPGILDGILDEY